MADDPVKPTGETPEPPVQGAGPSAPEPTPPAAEEPFDKERAMKTILTLREQEKQWKKEQKELETLRAERQQRAEAEMTEAQREKARADKAEQEKLALQADILRRDVIAETGLPAGFADRLKGANKDEMLADAKELLKLIPQPPNPKAPHLNSTNPSNGQTNETDAQRRERLFGKQGNPFDLETIKNQGGGVIFNK